MYEIWRSRSSLGFQRPKLDGTQSPVNEASTPLGRIHSATVNFKDISIGPEALELTDGDVHEDDRHSEDSTNKAAILLKPPKVPHRTKYVIILVGLPGRGKTFLCNKIKCYLNWLGHHTQHFNVGKYRRLQKGHHEVQNADFFDAHNSAGIEARNRALNAALDDLQAYLKSDVGQVAIFDATNTTVDRRRQLIQRFHNRFQYLFIESICTDEKVLEQNYRFKMQYSPDYRGMDMQQSLSDFKERIHKYEEVYEPINDRNLHYIKLIDMVTGRGHMDVNRISGYLPGKIVFFLMQVCKAGMAQARRIWLTRHGESEYNLNHRIGGNSPLSPAGEVYARCLPEMLVDRLPLHEDDQTCVPVSVWTSTLCRTIQTARYLPFPKLRWKALDEIQAGACDGLTYQEIEKRFPEEFKARQKDKLRYRYPAGESYLDVIQRLEPVIIEMEREKECIVVVGHQAVLRAVLGYFVAASLELIPTLDVPLHTLVELRPRPDGTMDVESIPMAAETAAAMEAAMAAGPPPGGPFSSGSFSGMPSPMLSPMYSMGRHGSPVTAAAAAVEETVAAAAAEPPPPPGLALAAAGATAWSSAPESSSLLFAAATNTGVGNGEQTVISPELLPMESPAATVAAMMPDGDATAAISSCAKSHHSRSPSLNSGMGGGAVQSASGSSPSSGFHFAAVASPIGAVAATTLCADGAAGVESPSSRSAALAAAAADSRTRKVRVPYGAIMGGGGSEGGAPLDALPPHGVAIAGDGGGGARPWSICSSSAAPTLQRGRSLGFPPGGTGGDAGRAAASIIRQMHQLLSNKADGGQGEASGSADAEAAERGGGGGEIKRAGSDAVAVQELSGAVMSLSYMLDKTTLLLGSDSSQEAHAGGAAATAATAAAGADAGAGGTTRADKCDGDSGGALNKPRG